MCTDRPVDKATNPNSANARRREQRLPSARWAEELATRHNFLRSASRSYRVWNTENYGIFTSDPLLKEVSNNNL
jgi:hypothetical protein